MQNRECPYCFAIAPEDAVFCPDCGKRMEKVPRKERKRLPARCSRCGAVLPADSVGCAYCGEGRLERPWIMRKRRRLPIILAAVFLVLWSGAYLASVYINRWNDYETDRLYIEGHEWNDYETGQLYIEGHDTEPIPCVIYLKNEGSTKYITRMDLPYDTQVDGLYVLLHTAGQTELTVNNRKVSFRLDPVSSSKLILQEYGDPMSDLYISGRNWIYYHDILCPRAADIEAGQRMYFSSDAAAQFFGCQPCPACRKSKLTDPPES